MTTRVLIADDEVAIATSIEFLLVRAGYVTVIARDGDEALRLAATFQPQLAVLDLMLPRLSGLDVCRALRAREQHAGMKVLLLSARGTSRDIAEGKAAGADAYYVKPFSTKELMEEVARLVSPIGVAP